ncbi:MAG: peroxiredoxin family protein, partial [Actinomycetota bacterium]|nr:peroxiredoxin family protein [Actinomycetota bacterium]
MSSELREVGIGDPAPDVTLTAPNGQAVRIRDYRGRNHLILYFMRSFGSAQCQEHLRQLGLGYQTLSRLGGEVIAIGPGSMTEVVQLTRRMRLPYPVLSDGGGAGYRAFGLDRVMMGMVQESGTVVIDRDGVIRYLTRAVNPTRAFDGRGLLAALRASSRSQTASGEGPGAPGGED